MPEVIRLFDTALGHPRDDAAGTPSNGSTMIDPASTAVVDDPLHIYQKAIDYMTQGMCMFDDQQRVIVCNQRYADMYGLTSEQVKPGTTLAQIVEFRVQNGIFAEGTPCEYLRERTATFTEAYDKVQLLSDGRSILIRRQLTPGGGWVTTHEDISDRVRAEARIKHLATHDALTELPNRTALNERLVGLLPRIRRGECIALLWLDLDNFKGVNDAYGHPAGDALLKAVAARLANNIRETDLVARLGGDEFAILQIPVREPREAAVLAERLLKCLEAPFAIGPNIIQTSGSIGITIAASESCDLEQLMQQADFALYNAKSEGRGIFRYFNAALDAQLKHNQQLERDLRVAISNNELELFFQPIVNLKRMRVSGVEALIRWRHPERGLVPPMEFIPLAEETGLILPIGDWVMKQACRDALNMPDDIAVAVNVSAVQFKGGRVVQSVREALAQSGLCPHRLEIEITESVLITDGPATVAALGQLKNMGVRISMDDFGTGYSSLSNLSNFQFDKLKIDRSFIKQLPDAPSAMAILKLVAGLGVTLGIGTTAEGVETRDQLNNARAAGCTEVQGYIFSPPCPSRALDALIQQCNEKADELSGAGPQRHQEPPRFVGKAVAV